MDFLTWLFGAAWSTVTAPFLSIWTSWLGSVNSTEKTQAEIAESDIAARVPIVQAEISSPILQWPRFLIEMALATYLVKFWAFDKVVCRFHDFGSACITDAINGDAGAWAGYVIIGMFGASIADRVVTKLTGR